MLKHCFFLGLLVSLISCTPKIVQNNHVTSSDFGIEMDTSSDVSSLSQDPDLRIGKLSNGLTYYIKLNSKPENRAELRLVIKAGSMQEDDDQLGLAHFIEHMAFNGSQHFSKNELISFLETLGTRLGPDLNATTSFDETIFMMKVRMDVPGLFGKGILILRDWADGISFEDEEIDKERGVVIAEWRNRLGAEQRMQQKYLPAIFYKSKYANRLPIGDPEIVRTAPYETIIRFYKDWYRPDLMAIFVVGDINLDSAEQHIKNKFNSIKNPILTRNKILTEFPSHSETFVKVVTDPEASMSNIQILYKHKYKKVISKTDYREQLVQGLYLQILNKRLEEISRESDPPFIFSNIKYSRYAGDLATYKITARSESKKIKRALKTLFEEIRRVNLHGFTDSELLREKTTLLRQAEENILDHNKQESSSIIQTLITHFLEETPILNDYQHFEMHKSLLPTISTFEVSQFSKKWITNQNNLILITGSENDKNLLPDSIEVINLLNEVNQSYIPHYVDLDVSASILTTTFPIKPVLHFIHDTLLDIYHWQFENGVKVSAKSTSFQNEVLMNAFSPGGHSMYNLDLFHSARCVSAVIGSSGVGVFNGNALAKKLSTYRVDVIPFVSECHEGFIGSSSVEDLETMMQLIISYTTAFRKDSIAFNGYLNREKGRLSKRLLNPQSWFSDKITKIATQNHPRRGNPTLESYDKINLDEIINIYRDRFKDVSDMQFFFVGNFDVDSLQRLTSRYFSSLPGGGRKETWKDVGERMPLGKVDSVYYRGEAQRSYVQLIYHGQDNYNSDTGYILKSLITLAGLKLRETLREKEGGVYSILIGGDQFLYPIEQYSIRISFNTDPSRTVELVAAAKNVFQILTEDINSLDIRKVTEIQRQDRIKNLQENQFWMDGFTNAWLNNTNAAQEIQLEVLENRISKLTEEVLMKAARKYFREEELITLIMVPEKL